jgi:hypothetical protein
MHQTELVEVGKNVASSDQAPIVELAGWKRPDLLPVYLRRRAPTRP